MQKPQKHESRSVAHKSERHADERVEEEGRGVGYVAADLGDLAQWGEEEGSEAVAESGVERRVRLDRGWKRSLLTCPGLSGGSKEVMLYPHEQGQPKGRVLMAGPVL